jgi:hypothetical protein
MSFYDQVMAGGGELIQERGITIVGREQEEE